MAEAAPRPVILAVDDSTDLLALMARALAAEYQVLTAEDGPSALKLAGGKVRPDLILLDVEMPGTSGFDVCRMLKASQDTADIPVIFLTGKTEKQAEVEGLQLGAVDYVAKPINSAVLKARVRAHVALANQRAELERLVQERTAQLENTRSELIQRLGRAMQLHESSAVGNRVLRLGHYAKLIAQAAGAKPLVCDMMLKAAPLHDVGKLGVPSEVLRKKDKLSAPDWDQMKRHPQLGADIIGEHRDPLLQLARQLALTHHEHWDGSGYPKALKGDAIPWPGRVMAVVDGFEAMTTTQFYRDTPLTVEKAAAEIIAGAGKKFDPAVVAAFKKALPAMSKVRETYADALGDVINLDFSAARPAGAAKIPEAKSEPAFDFAAPSDNPADRRTEEMAETRKRIETALAGLHQEKRALEEKLKQAEAALKKAQAEKSKEAPAEKANPAELIATQEQLKQETAARLAAEEELKRVQAGAPRATEFDSKLKAETEARQAAEEQLKRLQASLAEALQKQEEEHKAALRATELDQKLEAETQARKAADEERQRVERLLAEALENLSQEKKSQGAAATATSTSTETEKALKQERDARLKAEDGHRAAQEEAKRLQAELKEALERNSAGATGVEKKLAQETEARLSAEKEQRRLQGDLAEAREQRLAAEARVKREAETRTEVERRSAEMAEVRKRIDAALDEARDKLIAAENKLARETEARAAAEETARKREAELRAEMERRTADAAEMRKRIDRTLEEAQQRLVTVEQKLRTETEARIAAEHKQLQLQASVAEAIQNLETEKRIAALGSTEATLERQRLESALKREVELRGDVERRTSDMSEVRKRIDATLGEAREKLVLAEGKLQREVEARMALEKSLVATRERLERETEARVDIERRTSEMAQELKRLEASLADARRSASERQGLDAAAIAEARQQSVVAEENLRRETQARIDVERRTAELAEVRKRIDAALGEAKDRQAALERRVAELSADRERLEAELTAAAGDKSAAQQAMSEEMRRLQAEVREQRISAEETLKREAQARIDAERRTNEMAEVRKRIDAALGEAKDRQAALERKVAEVSAERERLEAQLTAAASDKSAAQQAMAEEMRRLEADLREQRLAAEDRAVDLERKVTALSADRERLEAELKAGSSDKASTRDIEKRIEDLARQAAEANEERERFAQALVEASDKLALAEQRAEVLAEAMKDRGEEKKANEKAKEKEKEKEPEPDPSRGISRKGIVAARKALGKVREKSGK